MENRAIRGGDKMASCLSPKSAKTAVITFNTKGVSVDQKIKKLTGLDLREFDDAIVFKVALMVKKYLNSNPAKY